MRIHSGSEYSRFPHSARGRYSSQLQTGIPERQSTGRIAQGRRSSDASTGDKEEVQAFLGYHNHKRDEQGRRLVVQNGYLPEREFLAPRWTIETSSASGA